MKFLLLSVIIGAIAGMIYASGEVFVMTTISLFVLYIIWSMFVGFIRWILGGVSGFVCEAVKEK